MLFFVSLFLYKQFVLCHQVLTDSQPSRDLAVSRNYALAAIINNTKRKKTNVNVIKMTAKSTKKLHLSENPHNDGTSTVAADTNN